VQQHDTPSYTAATLATLRQMLGDETDLWFIVGGDALIDLPRWHQPQQVLALARLAVLARPGATPDLDALEAQLPGLRQRATLIEGPRLDIASSDLRRRLAAGQPVRYQLPERVLAYIQEQGLYGVAAPSQPEVTR
jgi:nicotinate-nucleotide adenylyltransferase